MVPPNLVAQSQRVNRPLTTVTYDCGLPVAFVVDEAAGYSFVHRRELNRWGVGQQVLLRTALANLRRLTQQSGRFHMLGKGLRLKLVWETWDGYDASRILLLPELNEMAALVAGNPVIAIPHRDYLVMFGDACPDFFGESTDQLREGFQDHTFPVTSSLFTLIDGTLAQYPGMRRPRVLN